MFLHLGPFIRTYKGYTLCLGTHYIHPTFTPWFHLQPTLLSHPPSISHHLYYQSTCSSPAPSLSNLTFTSAPFQPNTFSTPSPYFHFVSSTQPQSSNSIPIFLQGQQHITSNWLDLNALVHSRILNLQCWGLYCYGLGLYPFGTGAWWNSVFWI